jgi:hypothetical protein
MQETRNTIIPQLFVDADLNSDKIYLFFLT